MRRNLHRCRRPFHISPIPHTRPRNNVDDIPRAITSLTARTVARRFTLENERMGKMDRLSEKMAKAAGVVGRISSKIEARADSLIAREGALEQRTDQVFTPHESILD